MQQYFEQCVGKQRRLERKRLGISEAEIMRFDCVNRFPLQGLCRAQFKLSCVFQTYRISSCPVKLKKAKKEQKHTTN